MIFYKLKYHFSFKKCLMWKKSRTICSLKKTSIKLNNEPQISNSQHLFDVTFNRFWITTLLHNTYCVLNVNAALVMLDGKWSPLMISCHNFLLITSTRPPRAITKLYNSYRSNTDLAMMGRRLIGVPVRMEMNKISWDK